jgi:hypothetical protein
MNEILRKRSALGRAVAVTLAVAALGAAPSVLAQTAKEAELEARIAELEKLVKEMQAATPAPARGEKDKPIQSKSITPNAAPGTSFHVTGFVKADALWTDTGDGEIADGSSGRDFYIPSTIPVGGKSEDSADFGFHVKQSRFNFGTDTVFESGQLLQTRFEIDFYGSALGNQRVSNTYAPVLRHAYVKYGNWLVGQTWSNFMDVATLPEAVDFIGNTDGTVFVRQPQVRWTSGGFSVSAENPQTTIYAYQGTSSFESDDSLFPDLTARYTFKGAWGHLSAAGLLRELRYERAGTPTQSKIDDNEWSLAYSLSGKWNVWGKDDIRFYLLGGNLGRYVGLNFSADAMLTQNNKLESVDGWAGSVSFRHFWSNSWRSTVWYAMQDYDNDRTYVGGGTNKSSDSIGVNLFYSPFAKLDLGVEYRHANREVEDGTDGKLDRLQFTTKYSF